MLNISGLRGKWFLLFGLFLVLRMGTSLVVDWAFDVEKDVEVYTLIAEKLMKGEGFVAGEVNAVQLHRAPVYPVFLAGLYSLFGVTNLLAVFIAQVLVDAGTALWVVWLGSRIATFQVGLMAASFYAVYPLSAYYTLRLLTESLYTFMLGATIFALYRAMDTERMRAFFLAGIVIGLTALVRPTVLYFIPFIGVLMLVRERNALSRAFGKVALMLLGFVIVISPWTARNYMLSGSIVPVTTGGGYALWIGNNQTSNGEDIPQIADPEVEAQYSRERSKIVAEVFPEVLDSGEQQSVDQGTEGRVYGYISPELDKRFAKYALEGIVSQPMAALNLMGKKFFRLWFDIFQIQNRWAQTIVYLMQGTLVVFALYGFFVAMRTRLFVFPLGALLVYSILLHTAVISTMRYSIPLVPYLLIFAVIGLVDVGTRFQRGHTLKETV